MQHIVQSLKRADTSLATLAKLSVKSTVWLAHAAASNTRSVNSSYSFTEIKTGLYPMVQAGFFIF
jgi:hypothetical protein